VTSVSPVVSTTNDGDGLLPLVNLTATATARGEEIARGVSEETAAELREQRRVTNVRRPDGHGGLLFVASGGRAADLVKERSWLVPVGVSLAMTMR
jgi:hypothetical protein